MPKITRIKKKPAELPKKCEWCIHERVCEMWNDGRAMAQSTAMDCWNYEPTKESAPYLVGYLEGKKVLIEELKSHDR